MSKPWLWNRFMRRSGWQKSSLVREWLLPPKAVCRSTYFVQKVTVMPNPFDFVMFVLLTWGVIDQSGWLW
ncbi:Uncharacterised protein [Enterobacter roggenkampii]|nr:Uncharacterised protein [Enterobacter roggenkampii]